jgi:hypothetical protein
VAAAATDNDKLPPEVDLDALFRRGHYDTEDDWRDSGFRVMPRSAEKIVVAGHREARGYLFKKYPADWRSYSEQLELYEERVAGARLLKEHLAARQVDKIVVPRKWLCTLPPRHDVRGKPSYVVVVDRYDLCDREESERRYRRIHRDVLAQLCEIVFLFRGLDFSVRNVPFTRDGAIAFIDTEHVKLTKPKKLASRRESYAANLGKMFSDRDLRFAMSLWSDFVKRHRPD